MTILPNQSGEIRLTANLLDTRRRFAPPTKGAGSGSLGGHREKDGGRQNGYGQAGRFAWRRISGYAATLCAANEKGRGAEGWAGIERRMAGGGTGTAKRGDSPGGESLDTRRRRSRRQRRSAGSEGIAKRQNENGQEERGRWEAKSLASRGNASG